MIRRYFVMSNSAPKRLSGKSGNSSLGPVIAALAAAAVIALAAGGYFGLCAWVKDNGLLLPGTTVSGLPDGQSVDLSRMDAAAAAQTLDGHLDADLSQRALTVRYGDGQTAVLDGELFDADPALPVARALEEKAAQPLYMLGAMWLGLGEGSEQTVSAFTISDEGHALIERLADQIAQAMYVAPVDFTYKLTDLTVELTRGTDGQGVDREALIQAIEEALLSGEETLDVIPVPVPSAELSGEILSQLVYQAPQSSSVGADGKLTPTTVGHSVDAAEAQEILDGTPDGEACSIPLIFLQPDLSDAEALLYRDLLASSETYMAGPSGRRTNIRLAAAAVNDTVVLPGETFSYNKVVGERTAEKGYQKATVYVKGEDLQELGGGICQLASALYYCCFYSDLEIVSRANHRFAVTYVPHGLDATISWGTLDYKFRNNTNYPIRISAVTEGNNLIVKLYGTKENDNYVKEEIHRLSTTPFSTVYVVDESLAAGKTDERVHAYTGYKYEVYRCVYDGDGNLLSRTFENTSTYSYRDKVIAVSPADAAQYGLSGGTTDTPPPETDPPVVTDPVETAAPDVTEPPVTVDPPVDPTPEPTDESIPPWELPLPAEPSPSPELPSYVDPIIPVQPNEPAASSAPDYSDPDAGEDGYLSIPVD